MSVAVATAVTNHRLEAEEQQLALCRSVINNRLYFDDGKKRNQWAHCREYNVACAHDKTADPEQLI